ncbi:MAG: serine/threonine protein kinase [Planctomycetota bacterium]|nr:serine/threonine protein kinase [Planctomycetaceae bacterium]MDQ3330048.1 serine/threonine protein kinase [Planctomycetota bacterium]
MAQKQETIDDWALGEVLGVGTVGTVYRVVHTQTGRVAALKILLPQVSQDETISGRFTREIQILERLSHPNVVAFYASGKHDGRWYYVMELVDGGVLKKLLNRKGALAWQDAVEIGWQVCSALQHLHNNGVIHRDLKPANLFFTKDGKVKLGDFGIALDTARAELTATGLTVGTYLYMSPEQIRGERTISPQTDLYALGCLLYEMLTGRPPFQGENFARIFDQHLKSTAPPVTTFSPTCPRELSDLVDQLLQKQPERRPFNARAVQGQLAEILMRWDEAESTANEDRRKANRRQPDIWAIERRRPILANLLADEVIDERAATSWGALALMALLAIGLIVVGWAASRPGG